MSKKPAPKTKAPTKPAPAKAAKAANPAEPAAPAWAQRIERKLDAMNRTLGPLKDAVVAAKATPGTPAFGAPAGVQLPAQAAAAVADVSPAAPAAPLAPPAGQGPAPDPAGDVEVRVGGPPEA